MTVFSLVSQSLRNGEPLHQVLPQSLVGRLMYHHYNHHYLHQAAPRDQSGQYLTVDTVSSLDYMYYATGVVAVFLVLRVSALTEQSQHVVNLITFSPSMSSTESRRDFVAKFRSRGLRAGGLILRANMFSVCNLSYNN